MTRARRWGERRVGAIAQFVFGGEKGTPKIYLASEKNYSPMTKRGRALRLCLPAGGRILRAQSASNLGSAAGCGREKKKKSGSHLPCGGRGRRSGPLRSKKTPAKGDAPPRLVRRKKGWRGSEAAIPKTRVAPSPTEVEKNSPLGISNLMPGKKRRETLSLHEWTGIQPRRRGRS